MTRLSLFSVVLLLVFASQSFAQLSYSGVRSLVLEHDSRLDDLDDAVESAVSTNDATTTNGPYLLDFDIHYQIDKVGSYNENPYE